MVYSTAMRVIIVASASQLLSACAATPVVQQSSELADAGTAYATVAAQVFTDARDKYLDWNARALLG